MIHRPIYLDCHATTPVDPRVVAAMQPYWTESMGNPSSVGHLYGWEAAAAVSQARDRLAQAIHAAPEELVFTSGATEANNLAIKGVAEAYFSKGQHIITVATEHSAVLEPCRYLKTLGFEITELPVQADGLLDVATLEQALRPDTVLVSVMAANNEIGVLQSLTQIGSLCRDQGVLFHTDAAQALGKIPLDVDAMHIDLLSMTAHKLYGPKGVGALYVRRRNPRVQLAPQLHGGGQEKGYRSGTLYTPQIVGFAEAVNLALSELELEADRLRQLRDRLWGSLQGLGGIHLNGHFTQRLPGNLNISIEQVDPQSLMLGLRGAIAVSSGSACASAAGQPSHVLRALGRPDLLAQASLRFGLGRFTTDSEVDTATTVVLETVRSLREVSVEM
ncbi:MAG: aminotransferase class V-fold PLP-dependent enzyme [Elainellaceae cyanobacterium]